MRIGFMCHASFGGSARVAIDLAVALARRGHRVHVFTGPGPLVDGRREPNMVFHTVAQDGSDRLHPTTLHTRWSDEDFQRYTTRILQVIATEGLDVLHFHYAVPFAFVARTLRDVLAGGAPLLIGTLHGTDVTNFGRDPVMGPQLSEALQANDVLTTVSNSHARLSAQVLGLPSYPQVIPNFIDVQRFRPDDRQSFPSGRRPRIAHISNFRPVKDARSMARIFLGIRTRLDAELWLIGSGEEMGAVRSIFDSSTFAGDVIYMGLQNDVAPLLRQVDLLLVTSRHESFSLVALEAMATGVPVLATEVGGLPEVVLHGRTGMLFPPRDHALAVDMAVDLLSDPERRRNMRESAVRHARQFTVERAVRSYEEIYQHGAPTPTMDPVSTFGG